MAEHKNGVGLPPIPTLPGNPGLYGAGIPPIEKPVTRYWRTTNGYVGTLANPREVVGLAGNCLRITFDSVFRNLLSGGVPWYDLWVIFNNPGNEPLHFPVDCDNTYSIMHTKQIVIRGFQFNKVWLAGDAAMVTASDSFRATGANAIYCNAMMDSNVINMEMRVDA